MSPRIMLIAFLAAALNLAAWFLPVIHMPALGSAGRDMPGWEVFKSLLPVGDVSFSAPTSAGDVGWGLLYLSSPLTNFLFVLGLALALRATTSSRNIQRAEVAIWASVALNSAWIRTGPSGLLVGYYLWLASFIMLALSLTGRRRRGFLGDAALPQRPS